MNEIFGNEWYAARLIFSCETHEMTSSGYDDRTDILLEIIDPEDGALKYVLNQEALYCPGEGKHLFFVTLQTNPNETFSAAIEVLRNDAEG